MKVRLLVVHGRPEGKSLEFPTGEYVFGRGTECHIRPNSDWVSRQHCMLRVTADGLYVRDLGSRNGTLVNGKRILDERRLEPHDQLQVGPLVFEVQMGEGPSVPAARRPTGDTATYYHDTAEMPKAPHALPDTSEQPAAPREAAAVRSAS
jgi:pSer/pThr/pTyr-binding forkhead associated (FHA) protein